MSKKPSKPETRIEDYLDVMTGGNAVLPQPILRIEFYYAFLAGMTVELPQPILDDEKLLAKICGMEVEAPTYIPGLFPRLYAYMAKKGGQDVQVPDPILRLERYWYDYSAGSPPSVREYTGAVPVTFVADGTPLLDYLISGNTVQSGTPTPENPIMPQGTGERAGNLFDEVYPNISGTLRYKPIYVGDGTFTLSTTTPYESGVASVFLLSGNASSGASTSGNGAWLKHKVTTQSIDGYVTIAYRHYSGTTSPVDCQTMLNKGSTPLPYESYGYKIPISSAGQTTPIYLGEVQTTRRIGKIDLGTLNWTKTASGNFNAATTIPNIRTISNLSTGNAICDMFKEVTPNAVANEPYSFSSCLNTAGRPFINRTGFEELTAEEFKQAISGVYMYYVLAESTTGIVNEPLMKIGDYADTLSKAQAGVSIPTANGSTTLDVETTVPPSEVYIKYHGEAVATLSTLSAEVSNPEETTEEKNPEEMEEEENEC